MVKISVKANPNASVIKFLCSYGGKILPRYPDGKLRYTGGETRVLAVDRSVSFSELLKKLEDLYGSAVSLRCQLPTEDLDALVSITSDEDLCNIIEEYDCASRERADQLKVRAFLAPPKSKVSPPGSSAGGKSSPAVGSSPRSTTAVGSSPPHQMSPLSAERFPIRFEKPSGGNLRCHACLGNPKNGIFLVHNGNHWQ